MTVETTAETKLREAIRDAGFAVMETSGKWSIHCVTDAAKQAEEVEGRLIAENIDLAEHVRTLESKLSVMQGDLDFARTVKPNEYELILSSERMAHSLKNEAEKEKAVAEGQVRLLREGLEASLAKFNESDEERYRDTEERYAEAEKWRKEGDMYGWNFHQGFSAGCTQASIIFFRVKRCIENALAK